MSLQRRMDMKGARSEMGNEHQQTMQPLESIYECRDTSHFKMGCAHSNGKPDAPTPTTHINVRFASLSMFEIEITHPTNTTKGKNMKKKTSLLAALSLTMMALAGCGKQNSDENTSGTPEVANPAGEQAASVQPMPGAGASSNAIAPTASGSGDTNNPTATNATGATTNQ